MRSARSPIVGLDEKQLALIRIQQKNGDFYEAQHFIKICEASGIEQTAEIKDAYSKLALFMGRLHEWRNTARRSSLVTLI